MEHVGDDVLAKVLGGVGVVLISDQILPQLLPIEYVDAHGGQVALGLLGLLLKLVDKAVLPQVHDAETSGLLHEDLKHGDGAGGALLGVLPQHVGIVHLINVVAGEDQYVFRVIGLDKADVLVNGVGSAGEPGALFAGALVGRQDVNAAVGHVHIPGLAAADVAVELQRAVLGQNAHGVNAGVGAVGEGEVNNPVLPAKGYAGFCHFLSQCIES